jgi:hypothetical protein
MATRGFRNTLIVPSWLANRPGLQVGFKTVWSIALIADLLMEGVSQGLSSAFPGPGTPTALVELGRNRGFVQGPSQTNDEYAEELIAWRALWNRAGSDESLCLVLQAFIPGSPTVAVVNRASRWTVLSSAGSFSYVTGVALPSGAYAPHVYESAAAFDWDTHSNPGNSTDWADCWVVIGNPGYASETRTLTELAAAYGTLANWAATGWGIGMRVPRSDVNAIEAIFATWFPPHANPKCIIWDFSGTFTNGIPSDALACNGYCGPWAYMTDGNAATPQRPSAARYWELPWSLTN